MQKMIMLKHLPSGTLEGGIELLESLWWHIETKNIDNLWVVDAGEQRLLKTSEKEAAEAFVYGLSLAYALMPPKILEQLKEETHP